MIGDFLGYVNGRNLSKIILVLSAIAISTFAAIDFFDSILDFKLGIPIKNILALSSIVVILLIKDDILNPPIVPFTDRQVTRWIYYVLLGIIAIQVSTINFDLVNRLMNYSFLGYSLLAIKNLVALSLLYSVRVIHVSG